MEMNGTITFTASDGDKVSVTGISDSIEPYLWTPTNSSDVAAFAEHVAGLADRSLTVTFDDNQAVEVPAISVDLGTISAVSAQPTVIAPTTTTYTQ